MALFSLFKRLLPDATAWRLIIDRTLRDFFTGLSGAAEDARTFVDEVFEDLWPATTRELDQWVHQFGVFTSALDTAATKRSDLDAAWKAQGGQDPSYIQTVVQEAGFPLYLHDWWSSGPGPYVPRDPRDFTNPVRIGLWRCSAFASQPRCSSGEDPGGFPIVQPRCNAFLANNTNYLVNLNLTRRAPPPVPDDPALWPFFVYFGPETLTPGSLVSIPNDRRTELERLLLKLNPTQLWIVIMADYVTEGVFDATFDATFE